MTGKYGRTASLAIAAAAVAARLWASPQPPGQRFELRPCTVGRTNSPAECGTLTVFEDRAAGRGRTIDIHFIVVRAEQAGARQALFLFAGGPGQGSMALAGGAYGWLRAVHAQQDVVAIDQRGTGQSHPLACANPARANPAAAFGHVFDPRDVAVCRAALEKDADLTQYTTEIAVEDMEEIRTRLGYAKVSLVGQSYGTRLAQAYVRRHPERVGAVVLDGVVPFDEVMPLTYAKSAQQSLDRVVAACGASAACRAAHPRLAGEFAAIETLLAAGPVKASVTPPGGRPVAVAMSAGDFGYAVRGLLYDGEAVNTLPDLVGRAASSGSLDEFAQRYFERQVAIGDSIATGMHLGIFCAEDVPFAQERDVADATRGTFLGRYLFDEYRNACGQWRRAEVPPGARAPLAAAVPMLLVSGFFDPVTPPEMAARVARSLPSSRLVVSPTTGHGSALGCPREAVVHVLARGTLDGIPAVCASPSYSPTAR